MQKSPITQLLSDQNLPQILTNNFGTILVLIFFAEWNDNSKQFLEQLNKSIVIFGQYDNVKYYCLSAERCPEAFKKFQVEKTPAVVVTQTDMKVLERLEGDQVGPVFDTLSRLSGQFKAQFQKDITIWTPKVKSLLLSNPILTFLKGTPESPCPSSKKILVALSTNNIQFTTFNILQKQNEQLMHWLRWYTKCSVFPCVFVEGKFFGGVEDVGKKGEMGEKGDKGVMGRLGGEVREESGEEVYGRCVGQCENVVFIDGFSFQNKESELILKQARKRYQQNFSIYNVQSNKPLKHHIVQKIPHKLPFIVHNKTIIE